MRTRADVAAFLGVTPQQLGFLAFSSVPKYTVFNINKKRPGEKREIKAPILVLKRVQRRLADVIASIYESNNPPNSVHGFRLNRSIATNAKCHVHREAVLNIDLENFFPSINGGRIRGLFLHEPFNFPEEVADTLTNLCCDAGGLPQGAPSSPVLSNCICKRMDKRLLSFARENDLVYTRYADDITFSAFNKRRLRHACLSDGSPSLQLSSELLKIIEGNGFSVNTTKTHLSTRSSRQEVTGVIVNEKCNFKRSDYRELRVLLHNWLDVGYKHAGKEYIKHKPEIALAIVDDDDTISERKLRSHIRGRLAFYTMLANQNPGISKPLRRLWTMYAGATKEIVPTVDPESAIWQIVTYYDYVSSKDGSVKNFSKVGTVFKADGECLITAAHCVADLDEVNVCSEAVCEIAYGPVPQFCELGNVDWNPKSDYAVLHEMPEMLNNITGLTCDGTYRAQVGETVWAYGYSDAKPQLRCIEARVSEVHSDGRFYRVDRPFIEGMSGGPIINSRGSVIGIAVHGSAPREYVYDGEFLSIAHVNLGTNYQTNESCSAS
ncbi:MAG: trypsin-like peptidase domain-containing protein [Eggerthellaceae bacterium]|nr:trypsin-like peptidase domain-containing protein [Eggerthellaceae bacterium]